MNILQIHMALRSGGIEAVVVGLSNEMVKRHKVSFCSIYEPREEDIFFHRLDSRVLTCSTHKKSPGVNLKYLWKVYRVIVKGNYDVVNMHGYLYYYLIAICLLHNKTRFFYTVHSDARMENGRWDRKLFKLKRYFFKKGWIKPITISKESQRSFTDLYGVPSNLIYNGTSKPRVKPFSMDKYRITSNTKILFHPGRITEAKNQQMLCNVCYRLQQEGYDIVLLLAGEKQKETIYTDLQRYFSDRIKYLGERNDVLDLLSASDIFCLSSIWEGMPMSLLESLSVGCIPVCTPVGGIPEAVTDGVNGFLSRTCNEEDYYIALKRSLEIDDETIHRMRQKCMETFKQFDIFHTSLLYERYYLE